MAIINIIAFFICLFILSYFWKENLVEIVPVLTCMLILTLYVLAFCHRLNFIDGIGILVIILFAGWLMSRKREQRAAFGKMCLENVTQPSFWTAFFLLSAVILCTSGKVVS